MFGIVAIEITRRARPILCTRSLGVPIVYPTREEAAAEAASITAWYQTDIRPDVAYAAVPLPMY
jgi:hypothetical protein